MCFSLLWTLINRWTCCYYSNYNILLWWSVYLSISLRKGYPSLSQENVWLHCLSLNPGTFSSIEFVPNKSLLNWSDLRNCLSLGSPSPKSLTWGLGCRWSIWRMIPGMQAWGARQGRKKAKGKNNAPVKGASAVSNWGSGPLGTAWEIVLHAAQSSAPKGEMPAHLSTHPSNR